MLASIVYITAFIYLVLGISAFSLNKKGTINRLFLLLTGILAFWSFTYSVSLAAHTAEESITWRCLSVFGWGIFYSVFLHLSLVLTKNKALNKPISYILIYLPAVVNVILYAPFGILGAKQYEMLLGEFGWVNIKPANIGGHLLNLYYVLFGLISFALIIRWLGTIQSNAFLKRDALKFKISFIFSIVIGILTDIIPDISGIKLFPKLAIISYILPVAALFLTMKKFGLLFEGDMAEPLFSPYDGLETDDRTRLFQVSAIIFVAGAAITFLVRFFILRGELAIELPLSLSLLFVGLISRLIPLVTKDHSKQNTAFLLISVFGILFFAFRTFNTGTMTVWSVNVLFFMLIVILDSEIHSLIFVAVSIIVQIALLITRPEIVVTLNRTDYLVRIFIIVFAYAIAQFLRTLRTVKVKKYEVAALEQSVLEKISANFVSFSQENAKEKVDEMFEMSAGLLKFDFAYVLKVDSDHKGAYILNSYANCDTTGASYIHNPGEKISDEIFIVIETVITHKQPTLLEDTAGVSIREYLGARKHFMSKGVRALAALPVILDGDVYGILVVEYREHAVSNVWENRINILKILANLIADAEKKLLYERQLHDFAYFDETTGMPNLNMLRETLESMMSVERESGGIALLDIEIENLKTIYDTFGRDIYIKMNRKIASILKNLFDDSIMLSKTGDEEFIAVLPYCENNEDIIKRAQEVIDAFSSPMLIESGIEELFAIVNVGIALYPKDGKDVNALLESAELAGYEAEKSDSKFAFYNPQIKDNITETALLTNRLFRALQNGEFYLKFQPQINCRSEKTAGLEALLRLKDEDGKIVGPSRFVPILERTGLIYDVGQWVLRESIATHQRLVRKGFPPLRFSVNVSVLQFRRRDFVDIVSKIIEESRIDPQYIELELTESSLSDNLPETAKKIEELKKLGVSVAIDDFGKGYSSLHRLEIIHFDRIKIDKSIINNITLEPARGVVTKMIISLAEALDVYTIVEGVETKEQSDYLKHLGCTEIQGFYYSKPLSIEELEEFLRKEIQ